MNLRKLFPLSYFKWIKEDCRDPVMCATIRSNINLKIWEFPDLSEPFNNRYLLSVFFEGYRKDKGIIDIVVFDRYDMVYGGCPVVVATAHGFCDAGESNTLIVQMQHLYLEAFVVKQRPNLSDEIIKNYSTVIRDKKYIECDIELSKELYHISRNPDGRYECSEEFRGGRVFSRAIGLSAVPYIPFSGDDRTERR